MASINNVARHILSNYKSLTTMKLQKLVFYSQAHALATTGHPLFESDFQAWRGGPVAVDLYHLHRGKFLFLYQRSRIKETSSPRMKLG